MSKYLEGLNESQRAVVLHGEGPARVAAGAGSGKTRATCHRVARLAAEACPPARILCLSFSKAATTEMSSRLEAMGCPAEVRTFHSLAFEVWRGVFPDLARTMQVDSNGYAYRRILGAVCSRFGLNVVDVVDINVMAAAVSHAKQELLYLEAFDTPAAWQRAVQKLFSRLGVPNPTLSRSVFREAERVLANLHSPAVQKQYGRMLVGMDRPILPFDDMLGRAVLALQHNEDLRRQWASRFDYIIQDEAQDQNYAQATLLELLAKDHRNYMMVGDPGQTIYTFAGARPDLFVGFVKKWRAKNYLLPENYRCARKIVEVGNFALNLVSPKNRLPMSMVGCNPDEGVVRELVGTTSYNTARRIAEEIEDRVRSGQASYRDFAVLCRFNCNAQPVVSALLSYGVPVRSSVPCYYKSAGVQGLLAYFKLALGVGDARDLAQTFRRPERFLKATLASPIWKAWTAHAEPGVPYKFFHTSYDRYTKNEAHAIRRLEHELTKLRERITAQAALVERFRERGVVDDDRLAEVLLYDHPDDTPVAVFDEFLESSGYTSFIARKEGEDTLATQRVMPFQHLRGILRDCVTLHEFVQWIEWAVRNHQPRNRQTAHVDAVTVSTVHTAKGLEWDRVYLAEFDANTWPAPQARTDADRDGEMRLIYVATTRAKSELVFTYDAWSGRAAFLGDFEEQKVL